MVPVRPNKHAGFNPKPKLITKKVTNKAEADFSKVTGENGIVQYVPTVPGCKQRPAVTTYR
jgi:hypothetical protein